MENGNTIAAPYLGGSTQQYSGIMTPIPGNTFNVEPGQIWEDTDRRRPRKVSVASIDLENGKARVVNADTGRMGSVRLDRFSPVHHMRKSAV